MSAGLKLKTSLTARSIVLHRNSLRAERIDVHADRLRMPDRVGELHFARDAKPGGDDVLRHPAAHVSGAAIDLGRILAGERAAAVTAHAAVAVDDDLAAGQAGVALRSADDEAAGRVDQKFGVLVQHLCRAAPSG